MPIYPSLEQLNIDLRKIQKEVTDDLALEVQQKVALQALRGVVFKTPRDKGQAALNWQASIGAPMEGIVGESLVPPADGGPTQGDAQRIKAFSIGVGIFGSARQPYQTFWIVNNLEYVLVLDQGGFIPPDPGPSKDPRPSRFGRILVSGGFSIQAPNGMVDLTMAEIQAQWV